MQLAAAAALVALFALFQNCSRDGHPAQAADPLVVKIGEAVQVFAELPAGAQADVCLSSSYICVQRIYQPELAYGSSLAQTCQDVPTQLGMRRICADLKVFTYDSGAALANCADCSSRDGESGGRY